MKTKLTFSTLFAMILMLFIMLQAAAAATLVVTNTADSGPGTLRQAILSASPNDTITFSLSLSGATTTLISGELVLTTNLTIDASALANGFLIDGNNATRIFNISSGANVTLTALAISEGNASGEGGGIYNAGTLTLNQCDLENNVAAGNGGAIVNYGSLTVNRSTLADNAAGDSTSNLHTGGSIQNAGKLTVNESTFARNSANGGGAIFIDGAGVLTVKQSTIVSNTAFCCGGGISAYAVNHTNQILLNTIVAGNTGSGDSGDIYYATGTPFFSTFNNNFIGGNPWLSPLLYFSKGRLTLIPLPGSPVIDGCTNGTAFTTDQRGLPRVVGLRADIGAVELQAVAAASPVVTILSPATGQTVSNSVFIASGKAPHSASLGFYLYYSFNGADPVEPSFSNDQTNWTASLNLIPGTNTLSVFALDGHGNISSQKTVKVFYAVNSQLTVNIHGTGNISPANYTNTLLQIGRNYSVSSITPSGFISFWFMGGTRVNGKTLTFNMASNLVLDAYFYDNSGPTISFTNLPPSGSVSNAAFTIKGKTGDNVGVTGVGYKLNDGSWNYVGGGGYITNWSADLQLAPGTNTILAFAFDYVENESPLITAKVNYIVSAPLTVSTNINGGSISPNYNNALLKIGAGYSLAATAKPGFSFASWSIGSTTNSDLTTGTNAKLSFIMVSNLALTANFTDIAPPTNRITAPVAGQHVSNDVFTVTGKAADNLQVGNVYYRVNTEDWQPANQVANSWSNWTAQATLKPGTNTVSAYSMDTYEHISLTNTVTFVYVLSAPLMVSTNGRGLIAPNYDNALLQIGASYSMTATPATGFMFTNWTEGGDNIITNKPALKFFMASNLSFTANFVDVQKPVLTITTASAGSAFFIAQGKATDNAAVTNVFYNLNNLGWFAVDPTNNYANWRVTLGLTPGTNYFSAYAVDSSGNLSATNSIKFLYTTAPATLNGLAARVTPDGGNAFGAAFGATTFNQVSTDDANNPNAVGSYTYSKKTPGSGQLKLTYTAPPAATNAGLQSINLSFYGPNLARFTNGMDSGYIEFTSTPVFVPPAILSQTVFAMNADGGTQPRSIVFTTGKYTSSNLVTHVMETNTGYTYTTYGPAGALLRHADTNGQTYLMFNFFGTNYGTVHSQNYDAAGVFANANDLDFGLASQRPGGNAPTNLTGRSFVYSNTGHIRAFFLDVTNASFTAVGDISGNGDRFPLGVGTYSYTRTNLNAGVFNSSDTGNNLLPLQFIAPNFGYMDISGSGNSSAVLLK